MTAEGPAGRRKGGTGRLTRHVPIPGMMTVAFLSGAPTAVAGSKGRAPGDADAFRRVIDSLVLTLPVAGMVAVA